MPAPTLPPAIPEDFRPLYGGYSQLTKTALRLTASTTLSPPLKTAYSPTGQRILVPDMLSRRASCGVKSHQLQMCAP
jgi:hypothetical protein